MPSSRKILFENRSIVVPGEVVAIGNYKLSTGVFRERDAVKASKVGLLDVKGDKIGVIPLEGSYIPSVGDEVIGKVIDEGVNMYLVEIKAPYNGVLLKKIQPDKPTKGELRIGETVMAKIIRFDRGANPLLSIDGPGLGPLRKGMILEVEPSKVPRIIGKKGSMIKMLKELTGCDIRVGRNGLVWVSCKDPRILAVLAKAIRKIELESHVSGLSDRVKAMLEEELTKVREGS
ncbi:MAG: RNA-binding protein [Thermoproteota archaeon]|nr:MAG: RNA-binding protein [Candidatus Korarchaeota archaeon]RLG55704.1 MAG: RNA-binding protein [Candidatus Korarchaeota archaeon]